jgi:hypothetical protein
MNDRRMGERIFWLLGIFACFVPAARGADPAVIVPGTTAPVDGSPAAGTESPLERVYRLRHLSPESAGSDTLMPSSANFAAHIPSDPVQPSPRSTTAIADAELLRGMSTIDARPPGSPDEPPHPSNPEIPNHPALSDRFYVGVGGFYAHSTSEARLNSPSGIGTTVGFEDLLGLDNSDITPQVVGRWRMSERWRLEFEYFSLDRSNSKVLTQDIIWGNQTFPAGTQIKAEYNVSVARISAGYSFFKTADKEIGVSLGFHMTDIKAGISTTGVGEESGKLLAPLPVLSGYGQVALTDHWAVASRLDVFRLAYKPYEGTIFGVGIDLLYQPFRHLGFGLGFRSLQIQASATSHDWEGGFRSNYTGPIAFVSTSF